MINLQDLLDDQNNLQVVMAGSEPKELTDLEKIQFIKDMYIALDDEMHELLGEVGWKPWTTSWHINRDAAVGELVDAFHFFMNFMLVLEVSAEELAEKYDQKRLKNIQRMKDKYDGVSTKCPRCRREYSDEFVYCLPAGTSSLLAYCSQGDVFINEKGDIA